MNQLSAIVSCLVLVFAAGLRTQNAPPGCALGNHQSRTGTVALWSYLLTLGVSVQLLPETATAQEPRQDRASASVILGAFITNHDTRTRVDFDQSQGTDLDLEGNLGLKNSTTVARLEGHYWLTRRQRLDFSLFDLSRDASTRINKTIEFGDETFVIDTVINTNSNLKILKTAYTFVPITRERGYLGLTGGLYTGFIKISLSEPITATIESEELTAPLPVIGLRGEYEINDRITLRGAAEWFRINAGKVDGRLRDFYLGVDYGFNERMAVGLAYNDVSMTINASKSGRYDGTLNWGYDGFLLYLKLEFGN